MSQTDESVILQYIRDNYKTPEKVMSFLCVNPAECTFLTIFRSDHPELHFLTAEEIISSSKHVYATNGRNLQNTMIFIETELREYYKILFDIWICFKFAIIQQVDDQREIKMELERTIMDYLPSQLITLLYNPLFDIFYGAIGQFSDTTMTNRVIQENVSDIVLLYSRLYIFLRQPDSSLPFFVFDKISISLALLSNVMVYKFFDSLHRISSTIFENYIDFLTLMFQTFIDIFGNTPIQ